MNRWLSLVPGILIALAPAVSAAQSCPPEVEHAKKLLGEATKKARSVQKPRALASARQGAEAPRGQESQAPRGQESQAPRGQESQAPRGQESQAPRGQESQAPRMTSAQRGKATGLANARRLVQQAETACKQKDEAQALANAKAAMELLSYAQ